MQVSRECKRCIYLVLAVCCSLLEVVLSAAIVNTQDDALDHMIRFGYATKSSDKTILGSAIFEDSNFKQALIQFQFFNGLDITGEFDPATQQKMNSPRCAVPDNFGSPARRKKRFALAGSRWSQTSLRYSLLNYTRHLPQSTNINVVVKAFSLWSAYSPLTFTESNNNPNIRIRYAVRDHGDGFPFDGPGGVLAHAFAPDSGAQAHFDDDETFTDGTYRGINLLQVTGHEIGHTLGLSHSSDPASIMAPYYQGYTPNPALSQDDINAIRFLYPTSESVVTTTSRPTPVRVANATPAPPGRYTPAPTRATDQGNVPLEICNNPVLDAIVVAWGTTYAFHGIYYYVIDVNGPLSGYPRLISDMWAGIGGNIDAALYFDADYNNNAQVQPAALYLFKGNNYYKYINVNQLVQDYPRPISDGFPGIPGYLDAAFIWSGVGNNFFIKGNQYYRYTKGVGADQGYPRDMGVWRGVPSGVVAAFKWTNGRTYFFTSDGQYRRFNDLSFSVDDGYPRSVAQYWFNCSPKPAGVDNLRLSNDTDTESSQGGGLQREMNEGLDQFKSVDVNSYNTASKCQIYNIGLSILATVIVTVFHVLCV